MIYLYSFLVAKIVKVDLDIKKNYNKYIKNLFNNTLTILNSLVLISVLITLYF